MTISIKDLEIKPMVDINGKVYTFTGSYRDLESNVVHVAHVSTPCSTLKPDHKTETLVSRVEQELVEDLNSLFHSASSAGTPVLIPLVSCDTIGKPRVPSYGEVWRRWDGELVIITNAYLYHTGHVDILVEYRVLSSKKDMKMSRCHFMACLLGTSIPLFTYDSERVTFISGEHTFMSPYVFETPKAGDTYCHFKGGIYTILSVAPDTETGIPMVAYKSTTSCTVHNRSLAMFTQQIQISPRHSDNYKVVPRFVKLTDDPHEDAITTR